VRILIDECLPKQLKAWLSDMHEATTVQEAGWANIKNGKLLRLANDAGFDVFVTADKNMYYQQNFAGLSIASVVIPSNRKLLVQRSLSAFLQSLERIRPGEKVFMDLGPNEDIWHRMMLDSITQEEHLTTHVFKASDPKS
jgi:predicted nuclease of predicted toxin-antitoxin system